MLLPSLSFAFIQATTCPTTTRNTQRNMEARLLGALLIHKLFRAHYWNFDIHNATKHTHTYVNVHAYILIETIFHMRLDM